MIDSVIRWSLDNRLFVLAGTLLVIGWGTWESARMPVDVFPDLTAPTVTVIADAHGMAPEEVEVLVTLPIETALNGASDVRRVRSQTSVGVAVISVDFEWGTDIYQARQIVAERLQLVAGTLPPGIEPPIMGPVTSFMGDVLFIGLTSDRHSPMALRTTAQWTIARRLLATPGVAEVIPMGGDERQFQVLLDPNKLDAYGITADEVAHALEVANENTSAGFLIESGQEHLIHGLGRIQDEDDIAETLIEMRDGLPILVHHVAEVRIGAALKRGEGGVNGDLGVMMAIRKQPGSNTLALTEDLEAVLATLQASLPEGMTIHTGLFRQADFIQVAIDNVSTALRDGAILVILIVLVFLMSGRATLITAVAIPLSLLTSALAMKLQGIEINTMTLGGMAIAVGALVDDAIIDVENVARRLRQEASLPPEQRKPTLTVVFDASKEIRRSIVFATLIIMLVFAPLFFLSGVEGRLLQPLGFAYAVSLFASLAVALTVTPVLCSLLLPGSRAARTTSTLWLVAALERAYRVLLRFTVRRWRLLAGASMLVLAGAVIALLSAGRSFLPSFNEGALTISVVTLPGTSLEESSRLGRMVERIVLTHPEAVSTTRRTGRATGDAHAQAVNASELDVRLRMDERSKEELLAALRANLTVVPGANITIGQPIEHRIDHMLSGTRANIAVKIFGPELRELRRVAERVHGLMEQVDGVADLSIERQADVPFVSVRFRRKTIARHGLTIAQVAHEIETAFQGRVVSKVQEKQATFDLLVRYDSAHIDTLDTVREARVGTPSGARLPLHVLAEVQRSIGPNVIKRENVERKIVVMCNVAGRDLQSVVDEIRLLIERDARVPAGYRIEYGGQFESARDATRVLGLVGVVVIFGIFLLLFTALESVRDAVLVMVNLPLALIGGVVGVYVAGGVISVASIIGFITLFGVATRNGIMMVTHFHHLAHVEGIQGADEVVQQGAMERLSPILMTALASGLGLLPLALAAGQPGSEIQSPMAIVILCGLVTSTALNMLVLPALYLRFGAAVQGAQQANEKRPVAPI